MLKSRLKEECEYLVLIEAWNKEGTLFCTVDVDHKIEPRKFVFSLLQFFIHIDFSISCVCWLVSWIRLGAYNQG